MSFILAAGRGDLCRGGPWVGGHLSLCIYDFLHNCPGSLAKQEGSQWFKCLTPCSVLWVHASVLVHAHTHSPGLGPCNMRKDALTNCACVFGVHSFSSRAHVDVSGCMFIFVSRSLIWGRLQLAPMCVCVGGGLLLPELLINSGPGPQSAVPLHS